MNPFQKIGMTRPWGRFAVTLPGMRERRVVKREGGLICELYPGVEIGAGKERFLQEAGLMHGSTGSRALRGERRLLDDGKETHHG